MLLLCLFLCQAVEPRLTPYSILPLQQRVSPSDVVLDALALESPSGVLGSSQLLDDVSFPVQYTADRWPDIRAALDFPATDLTQLPAQDASHSPTQEGTYKYENLFN